MFEKFKNPEFIKELKESPKYASVREEYKKIYDNQVVDEPLNLKFSKFRMFAEQGDREAYETALNQHVHALALNAYMALIYEGEYISKLEDSLYDVLSMYVWAIHAHVPDINEENYYELDLCSTALGATIATIDYIFADKLHPLIRKRIDTELRRRILDPFKAQIWHWEDRYNNWTSVCAGGVGVCLMIKYPDEFDALLPRFNENMRKFITGFSDDGVCYEGAGYWGYGLASFVMYALILKEYSNGKIDYFKDEKVKKICCFFEKVTLYPDIITNYGDTGVNISMPTALMYSLKHVYGDAVWMPSKSRLHATYNPFPMVLQFLEYYDPSYESDELKFAEYYMSDAGWYTKRTEKYSLAARGGWNGDSHNHNDVGSFILARDNRQVLIDMGTRFYTKDYFEMPTRYTYLETSSKGHNVPIINGQYQANVRDTRSYTSYNDGVFSVDFKELYDVRELKSLVRHYKAEDDRVSVRDTFEIDGEWSFTERIVSSTEPEIISDDCIKIDTVLIKFDPSHGKAHYESALHSTKNLHTGSIEDSTVYLTSIDVSSYGEFEFLIEMI